jgi:hypothetical protein
MTNIRANGVNLYYEQTESGQAVVLISLIFIICHSAVARRVVVRWRRVPHLLWG